MYLIVLLTSLTNAAVPTICAEDDWFPTHTVRPLFLPGVIRFKEQVCLCLPTRQRRRPPLVQAKLHVKPNEGQMKLEYQIDPPYNRALRRMVKCLGEPKWTVDPTPYVSDMINPDGTRVDETFVYPLEITFENIKP